MNSRTRELKLRLDEEKEQLRTTLHAIGEKASAAVDWRARFNDNPMGMLGAAVVAGALVGAITAGRSSARREELDDDDDDFDDEPVRRPAFRRRQSGAWSHVRSTLGSLAAQQAVIFAERLAASLVAGAAGRSKRSRSNGDEDH
ncbi:MAG: hypothetical protein H7066_03005 [Cytophagaceae bacterium]|nr:hypothetical protein [Gemmatimonadaceae bacterium]